MRFFILLFLLGIACAKPVRDALDDAAEELVRDIFGDLELSPSFDALAEEEEEGGDDDGPKTELGKLLQKQVDEVLKKIKETIDHGKSIKADALEKLKELTEKLKQLKEHLGKKVIEEMKQVKDKIKGYWEKFLEIIGMESKTKRAAEEKEESEFVKKLQTKLDEVVGEIQEQLEKKKLIGKELLEKARVALKEFKDHGVEMGNELIEMMKKIKEKGSERLKKILDIFTFKNREERDEVETESGKKLRETLDGLLEKIKEGIDHGKNIKEDIWTKVTEIKEKLKKLHEDIGEKARELTKAIIDHAKNWWDNLLKKLGIREDKEERSVNRDDVKYVARFIEWKDVIRQIKEKIKEKVNIEEAKKWIQNKLDELRNSEVAQQLKDLLKDNWDKFVEKFNKIFGKEEDREERSLKDVFDKVKKAFDDFKLAFKEKWLKFGLWFKEKVADHLDKTKEVAENIKEVAKEFYEHLKQLHKDVVAEGLEFLEPYKKDIGGLWDKIKEGAKEVMGKTE